MSNDESMCRFGGVQGPVEAGIGLYEFTASDGRHVNLHESILTSIHVDTLPPSSLCLRCEFEPTASPPWAVEITFRAFKILEWCMDEPSTEGQDRFAPGALVDVLDFSWDGRQTFRLFAGLHVLAFKASSASVRVTDQVP